MDSGPFMVVCVKTEIVNGALSEGWDMWLDTALCESFNHLITRALISATVPYRHFILYIVK